MIGRILGLKLIIYLFYAFLFHEAVYSAGMNVTAEQKQKAAAWFRALRDQICATFETIEDHVTGPYAERAAGRFQRTPWQKPQGEALQGGGEISIMKGRVFEKVGVNISTVHGVFSEEFRRQIPGADKDGLFWAAGISLVAHMHSPHVPAVHMNTRMIVTGKHWFGGGADLNPMFFDRAEKNGDKAFFHAVLKEACDKHGQDYYARFQNGVMSISIYRIAASPAALVGFFMIILIAAIGMLILPLRKMLDRRFLPPMCRLLKNIDMKAGRRKSGKHNLSAVAAMLNLIYCTTVARNLALKPAAMWRGF
jgi:Coproporphyrinogen III oxidase